MVATSDDAICNLTRCRQCFQLPQTTEPVPSSNQRDAYIRDVMDKPVRQFLTAGDADETVPAKSIFTPLFIRALEREADVVNRDGYVTGWELGLFMRQNLKEYTRAQNPQFGTIRNVELDQGDIVFRSVQVAARPSPTRPTPTPAASPPQTAIATPPSPTPAPASSSNAPQLVSQTTGVDYTPLRQLLQAGEWRQADEKTLDLMLAAANRVDAGWLNRASLEKFSCEDLRIIDREWAEASNGRYGFAAQKRVWEEVGGPGEVDDSTKRQWRRMYIKLGWKTGSENSGEGYLDYSELNFSNSGVSGHLPLARGWPSGGGEWWMSGSGSGSGGFFSYRAANCSL